MSRITRPGTGVGSSASLDPRVATILSLAEVEQKHVLRVLQACGNNRTDAALVLGIDRKTLYRKLVEYGLPEPRVGVE
jgi:Nif-specific regulatory protein